jgi:hypothetical protein
MTEAPSQTAVTANSGVRFSIRSLLLVMVAVAIVAGTAGPYFRRLSEGDRRFVGGLWLTVICGLSILVARNVWKRIRLEQAAGPLTLTVAPRGSWQRKIRPWQLVVGSGFWLMLGVYFLFVASFLPGDPGLPSSIVIGVFIVLMMSAGITGILWKRSIQIREYGLVYGTSLLRWTHVTRCRWDDENLNPPRYSPLKNCVLVEGVDQSHEDCRLQLYIEDANIPQVKHILRTRVPRRARSWGDSEADDAMMAVKSAYIQIGDRKEFTSRGTDRVILAVIAFPFVLSFIAPMAPSQSFVYAALAAAIVTMLARWVRSSRTGQATVPLVRLQASVDWVLIAGLALLAISLCRAEGSAAFPPGQLSLVFGLGCGLCFGLIFVSFMHEQIDFCENGVAVRRIGFWPWSRVRVSRWNRNGDGRLVLWCGWNRVKARVADLDHEVVDSVLHTNTNGSPSHLQVEDVRHTAT